MESQNFNPSQPATAEKQRWREQLKKTRKDISLKRRQEGSKEACADLFSLCPPHSLILSFASHGTEIDLWPFNEKLCGENRLVLPLPVENKQLRLFLISDLNKLRKGKWGILEPDPHIHTPIDSQEVSCSLIPGLGFDLTTKHRLGYGEGYYDRFLETLPQQVEVWGVGFLEQKVSKLPFSDNDIYLDKIFLF